MYLTTFGPPNSPPIDLLRRINKIAMATHASEQNKVTENARLQENGKICIKHDPLQEKKSQMKKW